MNVKIHPDIRNYLLQKARKAGDEQLSKVLSKEELAKTDLDKIKNKFKISNYGIFFSSIVPDEDEDLSKFRAQGEPSIWVQAQIQRVLDSRDLHLEILESLEEPLLDYKSILLEPLNITNPKESARKVRKLFEAFSDTPQIKSATQFFNNLALFIESYGILVFSTTQNSPENDFSGCVICKSIYPLILIHGKSPKRENFTLLHELGHLLFNSSNIDFGLQDNLYGTNSKEERWCNSFAAHFLLPEDFSGDSYDYSAIRKISDQYFVSIPAAIYHLYNEKILNNSQKNQMLATYTAKVAFKKQTKTLGGRASPYQNLLSNSISNSQLLFYAQENALIDKRSFYQAWAGNIYAIPKVFRQLIEQDYL